MQCACTILPSVVCPSLQYFSTLSHKRHDFRKKLLNAKCILIFSTNFVRNIFRSKKNWARYDKKYIFHIFVRFEWNNNFLDRFLKNSQILNFMKIRPVGAELFHADGQADRWKEGQTGVTTLIVSFRNFEKAPKINTCLNLEDFYSLGTL